MLVEVLRNIHTAPVDELKIILSEMPLEDVVSYWAFVASFIRRDHEKDLACKEEYLKRVA